MLQELRIKHTGKKRLFDVSLIVIWQSFGADENIQITPCLPKYVMHSGTAGCTIKEGKNIFGRA